MASKLMLAFLFAAALATRAAAGVLCTTPLADADDLGCVPPTRAALNCETRFAREGVKLLKRVVACHVTKAERPIVFDEEGCEMTAEDVYTRKVSSLIDKGCPACMSASAFPLGNAVVSFADEANGEAFCAGSTPFGGDDTGFVPPSNLQLACGRVVISRAAAFAKAVGRCHERAARAGVLHTTFDEEGCEGTASAAFDAALSAFFAKHPHCDPCMSTDAPILRDATEGLVDHAVNFFAYCEP
jgi:hypothetical protein